MSGLDDFKKFEIFYALEKQLPTISNIASNYGYIELDVEMQQAVQKAIEKIFRKRLKKLEEKLEEKTEIEAVNCPGCGSRWIGDSSFFDSIIEKK